MDYLIRKGNIDDLDLINLFLEKENDYMSLMNLPKIDIPDLEKEIENGNIYIFKKGKILLGVSCVSLSLKDSYFSFTKSLYNILGLNFFNINVYALTFI